jgi:hypothetical protein
MSSVTAILEEEHGIGAKAGEKITCPFCHHQTFSIKHDDTIGKCFHPSCEQRIIPAEFHNESKHSISEVLERFYRKSHEHLLDFRGDEGQNPYHYIVETRGIHPLVVEDALIGAVPSGMNVNGWFINVLQEFQERVERLKAERHVGRPSYEEGQRLRRAETALERAQKAQDMLQQAARQYAGWIAFFYTDADYRIVAIRFRQPYTKEIRLVKPFPWLGVFGYGIYRPEQWQYEQTLLVTEGEFNALRLQSAFIRHQEQHGVEEMAYHPIIAVGGVTGADYETIRRIHRTPIIFYDHDRSQAGFGLVTGAVDHMHVRAFTTPDVNTDPDEYVRSFRDDALAWDSVLELLEQSQWYYRTYARVAKEVYEARQKGRGDYRQAFKVGDEVVAILVQDLRERGTFYYDDADAYFLLRETKSLIPISLDGKSEWRSLLHLYGINATELLFKYVSEALYEYIKAHGEHTDVYHVSFFDKRTFTLYLSNHANQMYKITRDDIELVDNGTDGVLFQYHKAYEKFELVETPTDTSLIHSFLLEPVNFTDASEGDDDTLTADEKRIILLIWMLATFFESVLPTKPLLLLEGVKGSSKTFALRKFGRVVYGRDFDVTGTPEKQETFDLDVARSSFLVLDNADSYAPWLEDRLAALATGAKYTRRVLYSTADMMELRPRCFVALTSRTPKFRRDDVADRLIVLKLERRSSFGAEERLLEVLHEHRNAIMSEMVSLLQYVVKVLQDYDPWEVETTFRMADFAIFALKYGRGNGTEADIRAIFTQLAREQKQFATEMDSTCILLKKWARIHPDRWVTSTDLCTGLSKIAREEFLNWHLAGKPNSFAQKWKQMQVKYEEFFVIEAKPGPSRAQFFRVALKDEHGQEQEPGDPNMRRALAKSYGIWKEEEDA